MVRYAEKNRVM